MTFSNGDIYHGEYDMNLERHGKGKFISKKTGRREIGIYKNNNLIKGKI